MNETNERLCILNITYHLYTRNTYTVKTTITTQCTLLQVTHWTSCRASLAQSLSYNFRSTPTHGIEQLDKAKIFALKAQGRQGESAVSFSSAKLTKQCFLPLHRSWNIPNCAQKARCSTATYSRVEIYALKLCIIFIGTFASPLLPRCFITSTNSLWLSSPSSSIQCTQCAGRRGVKEDDVQSTRAWGERSQATQMERG